jgi:hypothetical protein
MVTPSRKTSSAGSLRDELTAERAKLAGIATQATKNATDEQLRDRGTHTGEQPMSTITGLITALAAKATPADIATAIAALVASSPAALDTLDELANALGDDPNFATTISTALGNRLRLDASQTLTTGQKTQGQTNLGVEPATLDARYAQVGGPATDGGQSLGATARRWLGGFFKGLTVSHDSANATLTIDAPAANTAALEYRKAGVRRFMHYVNTATMFAIGRYDATGTFLDNPFTIDPTTGQVSLSVRPAVSGALVETQNLKGVANGYTPLGPDNLVPSSFLPVSGSYLGTWNASTNAPALTTTPAPNGAFYIVSVAGTQSVTGSSTAFGVGDQLRSNGTAWQRIPSSDAVPSVFGRTGPIVSANGDYNALQITYGATTVSAALDLKAPLASPALTGTPTAPTAAVGTNTTQIATMAALKAGLDALVAAAPGALDTLDELAAALGDDPNFATTILNAIAAKEAAFDTLDGGTV